MLYFSLLDEDEFLKALQPIALANEGDEEAAISTLSGLKPESDLAAIRALVISEEIADKRPDLAAAVRAKAIVVLVKCLVVNRVDRTAGLESLLRDFADLNARILELVPECDEADDLVFGTISELEASIANAKPENRFEADALLYSVANELEQSGFNGLPLHLAMIRNAREFYANPAH